MHHASFNGHLARFSKLILVIVTHAPEISNDTKITCNIT